jgi:prevent-host-death family protein
MASITVTRKRNAARAPSLANIRRIAAGEFKTNCLRIIAEVSRTGQEVVITKRGTPVVTLIPFAPLAKKDSIIGRLEGIGEIVGDPDDLIKPVFPLENWDMLK